MTNDHSYAAWIKQFDTVGAAQRIVLRRDLRALPRHPLISIVMPVYNPDLAHLSAAIDSVRTQIYENWELCIADDASTDASVARTLKQYATADSRIKVTFRERNDHIAACSNSALELATGEWVALLDQDDLLSEHALAVVAATIGEHPEAGLIYSDEDKIDPTGTRCCPFFKPDWNPELLLGQNYINHLAIYRYTLLREVSGFHEGYEAAQDYDLVLRCLASIRQKTDYEHIEIVIVDNGSTDPETHALFRDLVQDASIHIVTDPGEFNFSRLINRGAGVARGEILGLVNNDIEAEESV